MTPAKCPSCGGKLDPQVLGRLKDKILVCPYCSAKIDVPDEYEVRRTEEHVTPGGGRSKLEVTEYRRDLPAGDPATAATAQQDRQQFMHLFDGLKSLKDKGKLPPGIQLIGDGDRAEVVFQKSGAGESRGAAPPGAAGEHVKFEGADALKEMEKILRENQDLPPEMRDAIRAAFSGGGPGKVFLTRENITHEIGKVETYTLDGKGRPIPRTVKSFGSAQPARLTVQTDEQGMVTLVKWLVALGIVIAIIVVLVKVL